MTIKRTVCTISITLTKHALHRIRERGGSLSLIKGFLEKRFISFRKRIDGFEILTPWGRLIGVFESKVFVVKTFVYPFRNKKDYRLHGKVTRKTQDYFCASVSFPKKIDIPTLKNNIEISPQSRILKFCRRGV
jgi:hypothetical protein